MSQLKARQRMTTTTTPQVIVTQVDGHYWLWRDRLEQHDTHVEFEQPDGTILLDVPTDFSVFRWGSALYEVQGYDRKGRRWWVERVEEPKPSQVTPAQDPDDPRGDHLPSWKRS